MCTVSWCIQKEGYTVFFNRDENRNRQAALPPEIGISDGVRFICPKDTQGGGTWLLVNEHGLSFGLLNFYEEAVNYQPQFRLTRGQIPLKFAHCRSPMEVKDHLDHTDLSPYPPLHFLTLDKTGKAFLMTWNGQARNWSKPAWESLPLSTSSFETTQVLAARRNQWQKTLLLAENPAEAMLAFHTSIEPHPPAFATLMSRPDAKTVSVSQISVSNFEVTMSYQARPDDTVKLEAPVRQTITRSKA